MAELSGKRALVTGASSGIGAAIARELAALGVNLVITARRKAALDALAAELVATGVRVDVVTADLGRADAAAEVWAAASKTGPIDILINNAGFGYFRPFAQAEWARDAEMIQLNMTTLVELCRRFVAEQRAGYIVNIASIGAYQAVPNMALYAGSKAFVRNFTEALHDELRGTQMSATCVCPGGTETAFHSAAGAGDYGWLANASMMSAEAVAKISVRAMQKRKRNVIPGLMNKIACWSVRLVPRRLAAWMAGRIMGKPKAELPSRSVA
jgi:short-subunit dehydrogenase